MIHIYIHTYIHTYVYTYVHTYMHTYIHAYIHTCIHTYNMRAACASFGEAVTCFTCFTCFTLHVVPKDLLYLAALLGRFARCRAFTCFTTCFAWQAVAAGLCLSSLVLGGFVAPVLNLLYYMLDLAGCRYRVRRTDMLTC